MLPVTVAMATPNSIYRSAPSGVFMSVPSVYSIKDGFLEVF